MAGEKENLNYCWSSLVVEELVRNGIDYFCVSPGSRSTPLTAAAASNSSAYVNMFYDERGSGFHAIGYSRFKNKPSAVITTSGTAVANLYPAVIEAYYSSIPLIILTADRPPELQGVNANQTIDQIGIFGKYARWFLSLPCPDKSMGPEFVLDSISNTAMRCMSAPRGPVHINCQFRIPLEPEPFDYSDSYFKNIRKWVESKKPYNGHEGGADDSVNSEDGQIDDVMDIIDSTEKGLLSVGTLDNADTVQAMGLAKKLKWPVYADITSGLRLGGAGSNIIRHFDQELLSDPFNSDARPDTVLHLGGRITSKRFGQFFRQNRPQHFIAVNENGLRFDPAQGYNMYIDASVESFAGIVEDMLSEKKESPFLDFYRKRNSMVQDIIEKNIKEAKELNEVLVARHISKVISEGSSIFLSSSMPVRDMDLYGTSGRKDIRVGCNRGASGIDGVLASASGFTAAGSNASTLIIGDQAFIHDMNSLSIIERLNLPLTVVVINNRGGGIFDFLPISEYREIFEKYFVTPHNYNFKGVCSSFGIDYSLVEDSDAFIKKYDESAGKGGPLVLEVKTDRAFNLRLRRKIKAEIIKMLDGK